MCNLIEIGLPALEEWADRPGPARPAWPGLAGLAYLAWPGLPGLAWLAGQAGQAALLGPVSPCQDEPVGFPLLVIRAYKGYIREVLVTYQTIPGQTRPDQTRPDQARPG